MGETKIKVLIVDDIADTRENLRRLLQLEDDISIVGEAGNGEEAVALAKQCCPDVILMDINMPVMDGIQATERLSVENPQIAIIILSVQGEQEYLRKAMTAGARDYLIKPPSSDDLIRTLHHVHELEQKRLKTLVAVDDAARNPGVIFTLFSTKGGVGKSTIAVNLAAALAQMSSKKTVIVDLDLQFGDVAMLLDLIPRRTISDLVGEPDLQDIKVIESYLMTHEATGLKVLPAPLRPEHAEVVDQGQVENIIKTLQVHYDYIIIDTRQAFDDLNLTILDLSTVILMVATLDVLTIKNVKLGLEVMASLQYESSKIKLVLNRSTADMGVSASDLENSLKFPVTGCLPSDGKVVVMAANRGIPLVVGEAKTPVSEAFFQLAATLTGEGSLKTGKNPSRGWLNLIRR